MWNLSPNDLHQFKGGGGERFVHFVDRLIRGEAARNGLAQSEIDTQLRVNVKDGGVDTRVRAPVPDDQAGWFAVPTCWQFKTEDAVSISDKALRDEIQKPFARELIKQGNGYRLCVLGDLTPEKIDEKWEEILVEEVNAINPDAPAPRVVHGGYLLQWAERFPAIVACYRNLPEGVFHWEAWKSNTRKVTPNYISNPEWAYIQEQIVQHADLALPPIGNDPCLAIGGSAGVGKTRLVFETLSESPGAPSMVIYAADEQEAKMVATAIAINAEQSAILIADECSLTIRHYLNENLRGHSDRLRVICLDNSGERIPGIKSRIWMSSDDLKNTDEILEANFTEVPRDRRRQYAQLSRGFVRLAADMCKHDLELAGGDMSGLLGTVENYVRNRLQPEDLRLISLLALFNKIGFRDDVARDLESLSQFAGCPPQRFREMVRVVKESPGFVVQAGRYWYVTPDIVARVLFAEGWQRWVADDPAGFIQLLPDELARQLIDRVGKLGESEARDQLASFFREWFLKLTPKDLTDARTTALAAALVEASPENYLPQLRSVIEDAPVESLLEISGDSLDAQWGPRRVLVWLLEKLVSLPEFFADSEACLFHLALTETELHIGNNATGIWQELFSVYLSGTAMGFAERIAILRERSASNDPEELKLVFEGVSHALERSTAKTVGPPVVAGRLRPSDWQPTTHQDEQDCYRLALQLCDEHLADGDSLNRCLAFNVVSDNVSFLLYQGLFNELTGILKRERLQDQEVRVLLNQVDRFLEIEEGRGDANSRVQDRLKQIREWIDQFRPSDFDGRLRSVCAREPWDRRFSSDPTQERDETDVLANEVLEQPSRVESHLDWLSTAEAQSAERLGFSIGKLDASFVCSQIIAEHALATASAPMLRGYVRGMVFAERNPTTDLLELVDRLEHRHPRIAADILGYGGDRFDALNRVIRLVDSELLPASILANFALGVGRRDLEESEVARLLPYFIAAMSSADTDSVRAGIRFLSTYLQFECRNDQVNCLERPDVRDYAWELVETTLPAIESRVSHEWGEIVARLASYDTDRAARLFGRAMLFDYSLMKVAEDELSKMAPESPASVMKGIGESLLDIDNGWHLQVHVLTDLVGQLPANAVVNWIRSHGIEAARMIARHLPAPHIDESGTPVVPALLDAVLSEFDDDSLFEKFLTGLHSRESWWGDPSEQLRREAENARQFLTHTNPRIQQWARHEIADREQMAEREEQEHAERFLPS